MFGYLSEFWDAVVGETLTAWEYTADWFKQIGNAVAGAIGNLFYFVLHYINDLFVFLGWLFTILRELISYMLMPMTFALSFLKGFFSKAFATPTDFTDYSWASNVLGIFSAIPYWNTIITVLTVAIFLVVVFFTFKILLKL